MSALVVPFPTTHRTGKIRHVASILRRKRGCDADRYWRQTVLIMRRQMMQTGIDDDVIEQEIRDFADAVFARIPTDHDRRPGGSVA